MKLVSIAILIMRLHRCRELFGSCVLDRCFYPYAGKHIRDRQTGMMGHHFSINGQLYGKNR